MNKNLPNQRTALLFIFTLCIVTFFSNAQTMPYDYNTFFASSATGSGMLEKNAANNTVFAWGLAATNSGGVNPTIGVSTMSYTDVNNTNYINNSPGSNITAITLASVTTTTTARSSVFYLTSTGLATGTTYYVSALINISAASTSKSTILNLNNSATGNSSYGRVNIKASGTGYMLNVSPGAASNDSSFSSVLTFNTTYLVVLKFVFTSTTNTESYLYVNPNFGTEGTATLSGVNSTATISVPKGLVITQNLGLVGEVAGLRFGTSWASVVQGKLATPSVATGATIITSGGFKANWTSVTNASSYTLTVYNNDGSTNQTIPSISSAATSYDISGLFPSTSYYYKVTAIGNGTTIISSDQSAASTTFSTIASSVPVLSVDAISGAFGSQALNTTTGPYSFTISGTLLTTADVTVSALSGFSYSTTSSGIYTSSLSIPQSGGTFSQQIFVKFTPTLGQSYNGNIAIGGGGTTSNVNCAVTGIGLSAEPTAQVTNLTFTNNLATSFTINWTNASSGGGSNHLVVIKAATDITSNPTDATTYTAASAAFTTGTALDGGYVVYNGSENTVNVTGLSKGIRYHVRIYDFNGSTAGTENYLVTAPASSYQTTVPGEITSAQSGPWGTTSTWTDNVVPTQGDNVTITAGHTVDISTTSAKCYNLTIPANSTVRSPSGKTLQIYGTSLACDGTFGDTSATESTLTTEFGGNLTISGAGGIFPYKLRPVPGLTNIGVTFNANTDITAASGTGILSNTDAFNDNITYTINAEKTLNVRSSWAATSSTGTAGAGNTTLTIDGTCTIGNAFATPVVSGKTYTANINGTLAVTGTSSLFGFTGGGVATINVNGTYTSTGNLNVTPIEAIVAPVINVGSSGSITVAGTADFSSTTLTGYIGNTTGGTFNLASGGTIKFAATSGLESTSGPIRTTTRNFSTGANYNFVGVAAQVSGSDFPATVNNLSINNAAGVTLGSGTSVSSILNLTSGILNTGGYLTLANATTIVRTAGSLDAAPTFGSTVNVRYNGATAISSGVEIPTATSVLKDLTIATTASAVVTLASATSLNNKLTVTSGSLNSAGKLTLKSAECCTAYVGQLATGAVTGDVTVERYIPAKRAWRALTAPVVGNSNNSIFYNWQNNGSTIANTGVEIWSNASTDTSVTNAGLSSSLLSYNSSSNSWTAITNTTSAPLFSSSINNPFIVFVTGPYASTSTNITNLNTFATTLKATGNLLTGNQTYASVKDEYTFIGNPYASPLILSTMLTDGDNSAFSGNIWIWDAKAAGTNSVGGYSLYDNANDSYTNTTSNLGTELTNSTLIQSGQAFFVKQSTGILGSAVDFKIKEVHKGSVNSNAVFRLSNRAETLRVGLYKQINTEWSGRDGAMTVILPDANVNQLPNKMANGTENVAFTKNGLLFASEHHLPLVASDVLNVKVWNTTAGTNYKLKINTEQFTTTNLNATLEDLFTNSRTPLTLNGTAVEYPFAVTTEAASTGNRFRIVFENSALGLINPKATGISILPNPITGDAFQVYLGTLSTGTYSYSISNALGQEVENGSINNVTQNTSYTVKFKNNTAAGMYIMKVTGSDNSVFTAKIIKQ
jgi:hypothetical protein